MTGSQLLSRTAAILRTISSQASNGATTLEVASATGLARSTTQRVLSALAAEGLLDRDNYEDGGISDLRSFFSARSRPNDTTWFQRRAK